jgi:DNA-binding transcriptional regulator LsrR (DeoR family)
LGSEGTGLGVRATELAKRLGILQPAVSILVRRGEEIGIIKINDFSRFFLTMSREYYIKKLNVVAKSPFLDLRKTRKELQTASLRVFL